ncbi:MAG TPA: hypothetical protein VJM33_13925 [Microthrixaceae bacterium]|nr:hypothetical protein [Microthrixaceae bacterium]
MAFGRRKFMLGVVAAGGATVLGAGATACAPAPSLAAAAPALMGLWDAIVPGTWNGVVEDRLPSGAPAPGATEAGVHEWIVSQLGSFPGSLNYLTDWFLRAWAADLNLWAEAFHLLEPVRPTFDRLPLGPTLAESGRQYKIMLMQGLFDRVIEPLDLKYFAAIVLAKVAFYGDFRAETAGTPRVGGPYIGFPGPTGPGPTLDFGYNRTFGQPDARLTVTATGLVAAP